jgi:hypothetical protein
MERGKTRKKVKKRAGETDLKKQNLTTESTGRTRPHNLLGKKRPGTRRGEERREKTTESTEDTEIGEREKRRKKRISFSSLCALCVLGG